MSCSQVPSMPSHAPSTPMPVADIYLFIIIVIQVCNPVNSPLFPMLLCETSSRTQGKWEVEGSVPCD